MLSLTFGADPDPTENLLLNGASFKIQENLYNALVMLRKNSAARPARICIDTICIDQNNLGERIFQGGIMDFIYSRAAFLFRKSR